MKHKLNAYQDLFLFSKKRYPALICGVGTGKTEVMLLKIYDYCELYPDSLAIIIRKEYTDLRDSTIKDFETYFGTGIDSNKEYHFPNGSAIMFRHGGELSAANRANVLKNINLSIFGIEQAEEFETDEIFTFLRDRLRRQNAPFRQGLVIANANGHNWIWKFWKNNPGPECDLQEATTFDNAHNLPSDFIEDLKRMAIDAPSHYKRYVMNSHEELQGDDYLFSWELLQKSIQLDLNSFKISREILSNDVARYGDNETVFTVLGSRGVLRWEQTFMDTWKGKDLMQTVGKLADLKREFDPNLIAIDDDGLGGGVTDRANELNYQVQPFHNTSISAKESKYANTRTKAYFMMLEMLIKGYLKILNNSELIDQLLTIKFKYTSAGQIILISKEVMRRDGIKSPDRADALAIAVFYTDLVFSPDFQIETQLPRYGMTEKPTLNFEDMRYPRSAIADV